MATPLGARACSWELAYLADAEYFAEVHATVSTRAARDLAPPNVPLGRCSRAATARRPPWVTLRVATVRGRFCRVPEASSPGQSGVISYCYGFDK